VSRPGVSVEAVKPADDGGGTIVRVCEVHGSRQQEVLTLHRPFSDVALVDLLERPLDTVDYSGRSVTLSLRPFELVTLRFRP
jgi:alpha-mannosidase